MKSFLLITVVIGVAVGYTIPVPDGAVTEAQTAGLDWLTTHVQAANQNLVDAVEAFKPINATCMSTYDETVEYCKACVEEECGARVESVCRPEDWQIFLGNTINFFKDDIPHFFTQSIPDVFVNKIGGGVVDVTKNIGGFLEHDIGGGIVGAGIYVGDGVIDIGEDIGEGLEKARSAIEDIAIDGFNTVGDITVEGFNTVVDGVDTAIDKLEDIGTDAIDFGKNTGRDIIDFFGFGRRKRRSVSEPSCDELQADSSTACQVYLQPAYCPECQFDTSTDCPGYDDALNEIRTANAARAWMSDVENLNYMINEMNFDPTAMSPTGGFVGVTVSVHLFGEDIDFTVSEPINPYIADATGPIVAQQALDIFKSRF